MTGYANRKRLLAGFRIAFDSGCQIGNRQSRDIRRNIINFDTSGPVTNCSTAANLKLEFVKGIAGRSE